MKADKKEIDNAYIIYSLPNINATRLTSEYQLFQVLVGDAVFLKIEQFKSPDEVASTNLGVAAHPWTLELKISDALPNCMQM